MLLWLLLAGQIIHARFNPLCRKFLRTPQIRQLLPVFFGLMQIFVYVVKIGLLGQLTECPVILVHLLDAFQTF
jgi:hypothetical protein